MINWNEIRKKFPALKKITYLNSASESPPFIDEARAGKDYYDTVLSGECDWDTWCKKVEEVRNEIAKLLNAEKSEIAFVPNTSFGMNFVAQMLKGKGDVITMKDEFPVSTLPFINQGLKLNFVKPRDNLYSTQNINQYCDNKTKILVTSHIQSFTGFKQDLVELGAYCKSKNLVFVVNTTQSIGVVPIDVKKANIDFLVFSGVKWLNTAEAGGAIFISKKWFNKIKWPMAGWTSVRNPYRFENKRLNFKKDASILELGALCLHSIFVMGKSIDLINEIGAKNIENRLSELTDYLGMRLKELNLETFSPKEKKYKSSIVVVKINNAKEICEKLYRARIIVSERLNKLRISLNIFNNKEDINKFILKLRYLING